MIEEFTLEGYADFVRAFRARDYTVRSFQDVDPASRHVIIRNDVDMSVAAAERMAELEQGLGVQAVYFVLVRSEICGSCQPPAGLVWPSRSQRSLLGASVVVFVNGWDTVYA